MTGPLEVTPAEFRTLRVFALDLSPADLKAMAPDFLGPLLGAVAFDASKAEIIDRKVLGELGLSGYLRDGYGIPADALTEDAERLDQEIGLYALLPTSAFKGVEQTLTPRAPLHFVGFYSEHPSRPHDVTPSATVPPSPLTTSVTPTAQGSTRSGSALIVAGVLFLLLILAWILFL